MIPSADIGSQVTAALTGLGSTPGEVAQTLASKGIRGRCGLANRCAIAEYLQGQFPEASWVGVTPGTTQPGYALLTVGQRDHRVELPWQVEAFVIDFDNGKHPDLIAP